MQHYTHIASTSFILFYSLFWASSILWYFCKCLYIITISTQKQLFAMFYCTCRCSANNKLFKTWLVFLLQDFSSKMLAKNDKSSRISMVVGTSSKAFNESRMQVTTIVIWLSLFSGHGARWLVAERSGNMRIERGQYAFLRTCKFRRENF